MKIVIIGIGKIGFTLASTLSDEGHDVTVVDRDGAVIEETLNAIDVNGVSGNGVNYSVQLEAGVNHADVMIAATNSDEINMLCCLVAKKLGVGRTVARIRDPEYSRDFLHILDKMGLDMVVNPESAAAAEISRLVRYPSAIGISTFAKGKVDLAEMRVPEGSPLDGIQIKQLPRHIRARILVCAIVRGDEVYIPNGENHIRAGDRIYFTASHDQLSLFFRESGVTHNRVRSLFVIGGGRIAYYLSKQLTELGVGVKIVESDPNRCSELSELLPKAKIICGDGTDRVLLDEENFSSADACVAVTGRDEENIIVSMYARRCGIGKVITKISKNQLGDIIDAVGLESVVVPRVLTGNLILTYIRSMKTGSGSGVKTMYRLVDNKVEALEFHADPDSAVIGKPLSRLGLKENLLVCCIIRDNRIIIPGGSDEIVAGDNVIVTTLNEQLSTLEDILK